MDIFQIKIHGCGTIGIFIAATLVTKVLFGKFELFLIVLLCNMAIKDA